MSSTEYRIDLQDICKKYPLQFKIILEEFIPFQNEYIQLQSLLSIEKKRELEKKLFEFISDVILKNHSYSYVMDKYYPES
jgi:hypothetical protein